MAEQKIKEMTLGTWLLVIIILGFIGLVGWGRVQAMATKEFWIGTALIIVFGGGSFACFMASLQAGQNGNKRKSTILIIAAWAVLIAGFIIGSYFGIYDD
jgi:hypothetical protein